MAVVEYMLHRDNAGRNQVPDFIGDRGHWGSPLDHTFLGWIDDDRNYYVPDTIESLTKEQCVARQLAIHAQYPMRIQSMDPFAMPSGERPIMTEQQVRDAVENWYDFFVAQNTRTE